VSIRRLAAPPSVAKPFRLTGGAVAACMHVCYRKRTPARDLGRAGDGE